MLLLEKLGNFTHRFHYKDTSSVYKIYTFMDSYTQHMGMGIDNICDLCNFHSKDFSRLQDKSNLQDIQIMGLDIAAHMFYLLKEHKFHEWLQGSWRHILGCMNQQTNHQGIMKCKFYQYFNRKLIMKQGTVKHISMLNYLQRMERGSSVHKDLLMNRRTSH